MSDAIEKAKKSFFTFMRRTLTNEEVELAKDVARNKPAFINGYSQATGYFAGYLDAIKSLKSEKPAEDALMLARILNNDIFSSAYTISLAEQIQKVSKNYPAKQCAECVESARGDAFDREA